MSQEQWLRALIVEDTLLSFMQKFSSSSGDFSHSFTCLKSPMEKNVYFSRRIMIFSRILRNKTNISRLCLSLIMIILVFISF